MAINDKNIPDKKTIPVLDSGIFKGHEHNRFATLNLGYGLYPDGVDVDIFKAYLTLRRNVYVEQTGMLPASVVQQDGTESDEDDKRSTHFVVLENHGDSSIGAVACMRVIIKSATHSTPLPIEHFFPEVFNTPTMLGSFEASRFISRVGNRSSQLGCIASLFTQVLVYTDHNNLGPAYGVVEPKLEQALRRLGAPPEKITELKDVTEYNAANLGIKIDLGSMKHRLGLQTLKNLSADEGDTIYWGSV